MSGTWQIHRAGLFWLLMTLTAVVGGLFAVLPIWTLLFCFFCICWRLQSFRGAWSRPTAYIKVSLVIVSMAGIFLEYKKITSLEPLTTMLICGLCLKLLEISQRRDAVIFTYVTYFSAALLVIYEQSIGVGLYTVLCVALATAALLGLYQAKSIAIFYTLRKSVSLMLQSLPLMLVLFLVMPRLGAFWSIPALQKQGKMGVSGEMAPGDLVSLGKNGDLAFRATFVDKTPELSQLYWRGPVLSEFDGKTWRQGEPTIFFDGAHVQVNGAESAEWLKNIEKGSEAYHYNIILEATHQPWLFAIAAPQSSTKGVGLTRELRLVYDQPVNSKLSYDVTSWSSYRYFEQSLAPRDRQNMLQLPAGFNPKTRQLAEQWYAQSKTADEYIERILAWFNREFYYTLQPPKLGKHSVDEFLFETKSGFCSFYASSFTVLMRAAGIPARVVTGYQGAERHASGNYLLVHQYNAHGWAEVWLPKRGWIRIDPTAAVAPERISDGFEAMFAEDDDFVAATPFSLTRFRGVDWLNSLRMNMDLLNYYWGHWVLGYDTQQHAFLHKFLGGVSVLRIALFLFISAGLVFGTIGFFVLRGNTGRTKLDKADKIFALFCRKLAKLGVERQCGEGASDFAIRAAQLLPEHNRKIQQICKQYQWLRYAQLDKAELGFIQMVKQFRP